MSFNRISFAKALLPMAALSLLAACATPFEARVSRFQALPATQNQSFYVQASDRAKAGGLEFSTYAGLVAQRLQAVGYQPAADARSATLVVNLDYGVEPGRERIESRPGFYQPYGFYGPWGGFGGGRYGFGRGYYGGGFGGFYGGGFYDPFWGNQSEVYSYTLYPAYLTMRINRAQDNVSVFEGRAEAVARNNNLTQLVPNLVDAIFTNFPGRSGETVRVQLPAPARQASR